MSLDVVNIQRTRLVQLFWLTELALVLLLSKSALESDFVDATLILSIAIVGLVVPALIRRGQQMAASTVFSFLLMTLIMIIMWTSSGIKNNAVVALPGLLIFVAMIGGHRYYLPLVFILIVNLLLMGWLSETGMFSPTVPKHNLSSAVDIAFILGLTAFAVHVISRDNMRLVSGLTAEIQKVAQSHQEMSYLANHDLLTGLPNRAAAEQAFSILMTRIKQSAIPQAAVFYIDLDQFKELNDTLGHDLGDEYLVKISERLSVTLRSTDQLFRIGGDEFLVYLERFKHIDNLLHVAEKLRLTLEEPVKIGQSTVNSSGSIGMVIVPDDAANFTEVVKRADIAMYRSKEQGRNCYHFYNPAMEHELLDRLDFQNDLRRALAERHFCVYFQPIVDLQTERTVGAEALVRWRHPKKGLILPDQFIPVVEQSNLINELSRYVLEDSCQLLREILPENPDFHISVNLSPVQLRYADLSDLILNSTTCELAKNIKLEITESQVIEDMDIFTNNINTFHALGFGLFLDDFGTGYSNLGHLQKLQFEALKIDRSFVHDIHKDKDKRPLVKSITNLADNLGLNTVVEGVECADELAVLQQLNICCGQGYYWSEPLDKQALKRRLNSTVNVD